MGRNYYTESHTDNATVRNLANLNPLIRNKTYYVKIDSSVKVENIDDSMTDYTYKSKAYNK
jgi:hypothetical protein